MKKVLFIMMLGLMFGQTKLETRVFTLNQLDLSINGNDGIEIDVNELAGIEYGMIGIYEISNFNCYENGELSIWIQSRHFSNYGSEYWTQLDAHCNSFGCNIAEGNQYLF